MPSKTIFAEASGAQRAQCFQLGAASFGAPLSAEQYLEREAFFDTLPLLRDGGLRVWCLLDAEDRNRVITTCKTVRRDLFIRDGPGEGRKAQGFCLASVVCDPQFRGQGFTSILLEEVAKWADGPGQAAVTFLYTSIGSVRYLSNMLHSKQGLT
jgi:GNAT superfamily N-acetyltransferase